MYIYVHVCTCMCMYVHHARHPLVFISIILPVFRDSFYILLSTYNEHLHTVLKSKLRDVIIDAMSDIMTDKTMV